jgi:hypothetical protein
VGSQVADIYAPVMDRIRQWAWDRYAARYRLAALAAHDEVLHNAIEAHAGWLFKRTGDGPSNRQQER